MLSEELCRLPPSNSSFLLDASVVERLASDVFLVAHDRVVEEDDVVLEDDVECQEQLDGFLEDNVLVLEAKAGLLSATSGLLTELLGLSTLPTHLTARAGTSPLAFDRGLSFSANRINQPARRKCVDGSGPGDDATEGVHVRREPEPLRPHQLSASVMHEVNGPEPDARPTPE